MDLPVCSKHYSRILRSKRQAHHLRWEPTIPPNDIPDLRKQVEAGEKTIAQIAQNYGVSWQTVYNRLAVGYMWGDETGICEGKRAFRGGNARIDAQRVALCQILCHANGVPSAGDRKHPSS